MKSLWLRVQVLSGFTVGLSRSHYWSLALIFCTFFFGVSVLCRSVEWLFFRQKWKTNEFFSLNYSVDDIRYNIKVPAPEGNCIITHYVKK